MLRKNVDTWLKDHNIKAFFSVTQDNKFSIGAKNCMNLVGLGKLTPNMVMLGFKSNWQSDVEGLEEYVDVIHHGFDIQMAIGILRLSNGCDFSKLIGEEKKAVTNGCKNCDALNKNGGSDNSEDGKLILTLAESSIQIFTDNICNRLSLSVQSILEFQLLLFLDIG